MKRMASELKVDKFTGVTTAGSIDVQGEGTATTNLQQGLAKCWINYDATASSDYTRDSFNVSSTSDNGTGEHDVSFSNVMGNVNFTSVTNGHRDDNQSISTFQYGDATKFRFKLNAFSSSTNTDSDSAFGAVLGDLA
jgi:hypothetical protein